MLGLWCVEWVSSGFSSCSKGADMARGVQKLLTDSPLGPLYQLVPAGPSFHA